MKKYWIITIISILVAGGAGYLLGFHHVFPLMITEVQAPQVVEHNDLIRLSYPLPNQIIKSPLTIMGEARGNWFFEGDFPVTLTNWDGLIIAEGYATAQGEWMTQDYVPFTAQLVFDKPDLYPRGSLILQKDNPSGLPEYDDALEIQINFWEE